MSTGPLNSVATTDVHVVGGVYNPVAPNPAAGQASALQLDAAGNILVNIAAGAASGTQYADGTTQATPTGTVALGKNPSNVLHAIGLSAAGNLNVNLAEGTISGGNAAASATGGAVPVNADYQGVNIGGNLVGVTGLALGATTKAPTIAIVDGAGNQITSFGGGTQFADNTASGATPTGTLSMGWDSANSKIRALKVDASQDLFVAFAAAQHVIVDSGSITANIGTTGGLALDASLTTIDTDIKATQPRDVTDRAARLLGHVTVDNASLSVTQGTSPWIDDPTDRAARLLGVVYGSQGSQLKQTAVNFNSQVELATGATLYDARQIRALTAADVVTTSQGGAPWSENLTQVGGGAVSLGAKTSANSIPVVLATDEVTLPVSIAATVNVSVQNAALAVTQSTSPWVENVSQFGGSPVVTGTGVSGVGIPRVTVSSDSFPATQAVTGAFFQVTQPISVVSLPLPAGASTDQSLVSGNDLRSQQTIILEAMRRALVAIACEGGRNKPNDFDPNIIAAEEGAD